MCFTLGDVGTLYNFSRWGRVVSFGRDEIIVDNLVIYLMFSTVGADFA